MEALAGLGRGAKVFYRKDASTWQQGELQSVGSDCTATVQVGVATLTVAADLLVPANPVLQDGIPDVVQLSYLNEPGILYNLGHRYNIDHIYTWAGPVLIALNPCKPLPLYTPEVAAEYKQAARDSVTTLAPHIYMVAAAAFRQMLRNKCSQSLVVSGESGAGKTETTKKAMQYFATLAGGTGVEDQVLETNPILEAFGNAKTLRNHNSSRFGKLIQIHFNGSNHICGATIKTYLLEKSRVALQLKGERSFHIFYQLVRGVTEEERQAFLLPSKPQDFHFLSQSGCYDIAGVDDAAEFRVVRRALADVGVDAATQSTLFRLLSGLLWLGNIEFEESGTGDSTKVRQTPALFHAAALLGWSQEALITALTTRRIVAPGEVVIKLLKVADAVEARNSLAKAIYSGIFNWVVERINARLGSGKMTGLYIAILDIYGFEQFDRNSFEQLCINYANERLQQQFTHHLFKLEQLEYESEGVDWTKVEFIDNQDCLDVFELMPPKGLGILAVMESQCRFPRATDSTLHMQLLEALAPRSHFGTNARVPGSFIIRHYAGAVQYDTSGMLDKNKDTLGADLMQLMATSSKPLMAELGVAVMEEAERSTKRGQTVITRFGQQLRELIYMLDNTGLHFVRCIKPNAQLAPSCLDPVATLHQLRCCGVLEVARVSAAGFPTRYRLEEFASRYSQLLSPEEQLLLQRQHGSTGSRAVCLTLLERFGLRPGQFQIGHTKVFFRPGVLGLVEDRWARMQASVLTLQTGWRMYRCRVAYLQLRSSAIAVQALWRCRVARMAYNELRAQHAAAVVFQTAWRCMQARKHFLRVRWAVVTIQTKGYRTWVFSRWLSRVMQARDRADLAAEEARVKSKLEAEWFGALRTEYAVDMEEVPTALAVWRECHSVGLTSVEAVKEALTTWQQRAHAAPAAEQGTGAGEQPGQPGHQGREVASGPVADASSPGGHDAPAVGGEAAAPSETAMAAPPPRPPVMVMTPAVVTPAVVNRFELAQELAIQVERLNLENVKLQKMLALERGVSQRHQMKMDEQARNYTEKVRLLQAYIQKCRAMFGDSQLPPLPKQVAALTQPVEEDGGPAVAAVRAELNAQPPSPPRPTTAAASTMTLSPDIMARGTQHSVPSAPQSTQTDDEASTRGPQLPSISSVTLSTQTDSAVLPMPPAAPPPPPVSPRSVQTTTSASTQTLLSPRMVTVSTGTEPLFVAAAAAAAAEAAGSAVQTPVSAPRGDGSSVFGSQPLADPGALPSPSASMRSEPMSLDAPPSSSAGGMTTPGAPHRSMAPSNGGAGGTHAGTTAGPTNASQRYVAKLGDELERVMQVLPDDVAFIREVHEGQVAAPEMDPGVELFKLKKKFDVWKREFKEKLRTTEEVLRKIEHMEGRSTGGTGSHDSSALRPSPYVRIGPVSTGGTVGRSGPSGGAPNRSGGGSGEAAVRTSAPPTDPNSATRRKAPGSSKLLNKLFNSNTRG